MNAQIVNYNCDGQGSGNCTGEHSEVRILPLGEAGNLILCKNHWWKEFVWRGEQNRERFSDNHIWIDKDTVKTIRNPNAFDRPSWESLEVYTGA